MYLADDVKIAGKRTVGDWKSCQAELESNGGHENWERAYRDFFFERLKTRYFDPIDRIKKLDGEIGEGFSITTILCSLIEFLAATRDGKNYRQCKKGEECGDEEYCQSIKLFVCFLRTAIPFKDHFDSNNQAKEFYYNIRCPLFHEARTKGDWKILAGTISNPPIDVAKQRVYRNSFGEAIHEYLSWYQSNLLVCPVLQTAFISKFDFLCRK